MNKDDIKKLTKSLNVKVISLCELFPRNAAGFEVAKQIIRSSGSVGANYRAACRAKSRADFIYKLEIVIEESDETQYSGNSWGIQSNQIRKCKIFMAELQ